MRIVILEDNLERREAMTAVLEDRFSGTHIIEYFVAAKPMINHLTNTGLYDVSLISLDNDLELIDDGSGQLIDPGDGVEVARWLSKQPPIVPVIVHTTNLPAGDEIMSLLASRGWIRERIVPYDGETWIAETWRSTVRDLIVKHAPEWSTSAIGVQILHSGLQNLDSCEETLSELLKATSVALCGSQSSEHLCLEVIHVADDNLVRTTGTGFSLLGALGPGASIEILNESERAIGCGPVSATNEDLEECFRGNLATLNVSEIQLDIVQPTAGLQAVLVAAVRGTSIEVRSHRVQTVLRETLALLNLTMLAAVQGSSTAEHERVLKTNAD